MSEAVTPPGMPTPGTARLDGAQPGHAEPADALPAGRRVVHEHADQAGGVSRVRPGHGDGIGVAYPGRQPRGGGAGHRPGHRGGRARRSTASRKSPPPPREGVGTVTVELLEGADEPEGLPGHQAGGRPDHHLPRGRRGARRSRWTCAGARCSTCCSTATSDEWALRNLAEEVRDRLLQDPGITQVDLDGARDLRDPHRGPAGEPARLRPDPGPDRRADRRHRASRLPGRRREDRGRRDPGAVQGTPRLGRRVRAASRSSTTPTAPRSGSADIATVRDGFEDVGPRRPRYNGKRAIGLECLASATRRRSGCPTRCGPPWRRSRPTCRRASTTRSATTGRRSTSSGCSCC